MNKIKKTYKSFKNPVMAEIVISADEPYKDDRTLAHYNDLQAFIELAPDNISWDICCARAQKYNRGKFYFELIRMLLNKQLYSQDHKEALYRLLPVFNEIASKTQLRYSSILCGDDIDTLVIVDDLRFNCNAYLHINSNNYILRDIISAFYPSATKMNGSVRVRSHTQLLAEAIECSGSPVSGINDFDEQRFWKMVDFMRHCECTGVDIQDRTDMPIWFYRWLCCQDSYTGLSSASCLSQRLILSKQFPFMIANGWYFIPYNLSYKDISRDKYVIVISGYELLSSKLKKGDWITVNLSNIRSAFYRDIVLTYILSSPNMILAVKGGAATYISEGMHSLEEMKSAVNYPYPDLKHITNQEAYILYRNIYSQSGTLSTLNNRIALLRRCLLWAKNNQMLETGDLVFEYLSQKAEPRSTYGSPIPPEDIAKIITELQTNASTGDIRKIHIYTLFRLGLETEIRMSNLCHLEIDSIRPSIKPGRYRLSIKTKTSNSKNENHEITEDTFKLIHRSIDASEPLRAACNSEYKQYVFLIPGIAGAPIVIDTSMFTADLKNICSSLRLPCYTAANIRDAYMTQSVKWAIENGKSDLELGVVTKHKKLDTTLNNYTGSLLQEMLEATYQIIIGDLDWVNAENKVVDSVNQEISDSAHTVENGGGFCDLDDCYKLKNGIINSLPCFVCDHFITTEKHEEYFKRRISDLDKQIELAVDPHDIEDLTAIKRICVKYLEAIYMHKESQEGGC